MYLKGKYKKQGWWKVFLFLLVLIWILVFAWLFVYKWFVNNVLVEDDSVIVVEKWETYYSLPEKFDINSNLFRGYLKMNPVEAGLQAWTYNLKWGTTIKTLFEQLKTPINETDLRITILEWWNIYDIDYCLSNPIESWCISKYEDGESTKIEEPLIKKGDFINAVENYNKSKYVFLSETLTLEWFLYPDTYNVNPNNFSSDIFIWNMLDNFQNRVYDKLLKWKDNSQIVDIINLASIVEKEEKNGDEKPTVAWILKKRLNNDWMIGADITVCYPHELTSQECKMVVSKYIGEKSEYNTRTMLWLPKTPISNPSFETINATVNSEDSPYWFYLHDTKTGKIYYGKDNAEHERNKSLYIY